MFNKDFNSLIEVIQEFSTQEKCIAHLEELYWNGVPVSPFAEGAKVYKSRNSKYYLCSITKKKFTVLNGTIFQGTKIPLPTWFCAIYLISSLKKGISSAQLARDLNTSQKTAWYLSMRIKMTLGIENDENNKFDENSIAEADESFFGGKNKNRHKDKKVPQSTGRSFKDKTAVVGVIKRGTYEIIERPNKVQTHLTVKEKVIIDYSQVRTKVTKNTKRESIQPFIKNVLEKNAVLVSDEWHGYRGLENHYDHHVVDHGKKQYVDFDNPEIHSNSIENFWATMKRSYNGIYNWWSRKHMQIYCNEFAWRFNLRGMKNSERFNYLLLNSQVRITYKELTRCLD